MTSRRSMARILFLAALLAGTALVGTTRFSRNDAAPLIPNPQIWLPRMSNGAESVSLTVTATAANTPTPSNTCTPLPTGILTATPAAPTPTLVRTANASVTVSPNPTGTATSTATGTVIPTATVPSTATPLPTSEPPQTLVLQNGRFPSAAYVGIQDAWIDGLAPATTNGAAATLSAGQWGSSGAQRILIRVGDLDRYLPRTAHVLAATLYLQTTGQPLIRLDALEVLRPWSEGDATWLAAQPGASWQLPGCSGVADRHIDAVARSHSESVFEWSWDLTPLVQKWVALPEQNHGVLLLNNLLEDTCRTFFSSESGALSNRPRLEITYTAHGGGAPVAETPLVSFAAYGDSRCAASDLALIQLNMANEIARRQPDFVLHLGDMVNYGMDQAMWQRLGAQLFAPYLALPAPHGLADCVPLDRTKPAGVCDKGFFAVPGNHDYQDFGSKTIREENLALYQAFFDYLPNQGRNYAFTLERDGFADPAIHGVRVIVLDTLPLDMGYDQQVALLAQDLAQHADKLILPIVHEPLYGLGKSASKTGSRERYLPVLRQHPLMLLTISGDDHSYQRTQPPGESATFVVAAGGGAILYDQTFFPPHWPKAFHYKEYSFAYVQIYADRIDIAGYKVDLNSEVWRMDHDVLPIPSS